MKVAIIDADLIHNKGKSNFPNLACMKMSAYEKSLGNEVELVTDYEHLTLFGVSQFDKIFVAKVFTWSEVPEWVLNMANVEFGGTGFYYPEKAPDLPSEIEHIKPDYDLYKAWADDVIANSKEPKKERERLTYFYDYSIGFLTRYCFRKCWFCVNKHYDKAVCASNVLEFYDESRPKLCFLDDNFFSFPKWQDIIGEVKKLGKKFQFKQGLDERLLTERHIHELVSWNYESDIIFAFDDVGDSELIESKLQLLYKLYPNFKKRLKFYVFCGACKETEIEIYQDVESIFKRCFILAKYSACPYIMRYETIYKSKWASLYATIASWCNQVSFFKKKSFRQYAMERGMSNELHKIYKTDTERYLKDGHSKGGTWKIMEQFEKEYPEISKYYDTAGDMLLEYGNGKKIL